MPDVVGQTRADTQEDLERAGFDVQTIDVPAVEGDEVIDQTPAAAGLRIPRGSLVLLYAAPSPPAAARAQPPIAGRRPALDPGLGWQARARLRRPRCRPLLVRSHRHEAQLRVPEAGRTIHRSDDPEDGR